MIAVIHMSPEKMSVIFSGIFSYDIFIKTTRSKMLKKNNLHKDELNMYIEDL